ncbi:MAG: hypothetical protein J6K15_15360 [Lachnospiraceae bacterium]|nr:hypothetical protein [Lachnospiraceae bacterium]
MDKERNMPLWITAEIALRNMVVDKWAPRFIMNQQCAYFEVCEEAEMLIMTPPEDRNELEKVMVAAKEKILLEVGFKFEEWKWQPATERTAQAMTEDLLQKIAAYEAERRAEVKEMFLRMLLYSKWEQPCVAAVEITAEIETEEKPAIWNPEKALEGVFCPTCGMWLDDYNGQPEKCPKCSQKLSGWIDGREHPPKLHK